jgi:hypothetical protein
VRIGLDIDDVLFPWTDRAHAAAEAAGITNGAAITQWSFHNLDDSAANVRALRDQVHNRSVGDLVRVADLAEFLDRLGVAS